MADQTKWFTVHTDTPAFGPIGSGLGLPAGSFRIDPDAVPALRAAFEEAIQEMASARSAATKLDVTDSASVNPVVDKYMVALADRAAGPDESAAVAADSAIAAYQDVIDQLDAAVAEYRMADDPQGFSS